jgi:caspase-like apoptosis-related cysteine protease
MATSIEESVSQLNGLKLSHELDNEDPKEMTNLDNGDKNDVENVKNGLDEVTSTKSNSEMSKPTTGKDNPQTSSETDFNGAGEGPGQDGAGLAGSGSKAALGSVAGASPLREDADARPTNISSYQERDEVRDENYVSSNRINYETFTAMEDEDYDLSRGRKLAVIFNQHDFHPVQELSPRDGTEMDCAALETTFQKLGFEVQRYDNLEVADIRHNMAKIQRTEDLSCLALFILTHGQKDGLLHGYDSSFMLNKDIVQELLPQQCPGLAGKPKMIFVQACQGDAADSGTCVTALPILSGTPSRSRHTSTDGDAGSNTYCIPNYADFLIFQAAYHGFFAFRTTSGSWFIQSLCAELDKSSPEEDLLAVLTRVSRNVAINKVTTSPHNLKYHDKKQIPLRQDTLIRTVRLKRGLDQGLMEPEQQQVPSELPSRPRTTTRRGAKRRRAASFDAALLTVTPRNRPGYSSSEQPFLKSKQDHGGPIH